MRNDPTSPYENIGISGQQHSTEILKREPPRERTWPGCRMAQLMNPVIWWEERWEVLLSADPSWSYLPTRKSPARQKEKQNVWARVSLPVTSLSTLKQNVPERAVHVFITLIDKYDGLLSNVAQLRSQKNSTNQIIIPCPQRRVRMFRKQVREEKECVCAGGGGRTSKEAERSSPPR